MPARPLDLTGQRYGRLTAVKDTGLKKNTNAVWIFLCDCGNQIERPSGSVRSGKTSSCGCLRSEQKSKHMKANAGVYNSERATHGMTGTPTFVSWDAMRQRCLNPNHKSFEDYGGRGILVCERWLDSFENFLEDMGERPQDTTLDRKDTNGNYEPGNCRWATSKTQSNNKRSSRYITFMGLTKTLKEWADAAGISNKTLAYRLANGWEMKEALVTKTDPSNGWKRGVRKC